jgi:ketosteroid isomerase-like protein
LWQRRPGGWHDGVSLPLPFPASSATLDPPKDLAMTMSNTSHPIASEIIRLEEAALERWGNGDPSGFLELSAEDVVYFDPFLERRIDGFDALRAHYESIRGQVHVDRFELVNPYVHVEGDVAVLTFNYHSFNDGAISSRWNCTEVFRRRGASWRLIQTHWSFTNPGK